MAEFQASDSRNFFALAASKSKGINWSQGNWPAEGRIFSILEVDCRDGRDRLTGPFEGVGIRERPLRVIY